MTLAPTAALLQSRKGQDHQAVESSDDRYEFAEQGSLRIELSLPRRAANVGRTTTAQAEAKRGLLGHCSAMPCQLFDAAYETAGGRDLMARGADREASNSGRRAAVPNG